MPRHNMREPEKVKDFKGTISRIFHSLNRWRYILVLSCFLAMFAAILSTIAPNKLADVTDVISEGIKPNVGALQDVSESIMKNIVARYNDASIEEALSNFYKLRDDEKKEFLSDIKIDGVTITSSDQIKYLEIIRTIDKNADNEIIIRKLDMMPKSIKKIVEAKLDVSELKKRSTILGVIYLLNSVLGYIVGILMAYVGIGYSKKLRNDISLKINRLPLKYFDSHETGDILSRVTNDVDTIGINMSNNINSFE